MFTQFFGNYLLNNNIITKEQLLEAMSSEYSTRVKLGTLAIYEGLMTSSEVEKVHSLQAQVDKKFGELAIEEGYLTKEQVEMLRQSQKPDYLLLGQTLIDKGYITSKKFEDLLSEYQSEYEIENLEYEEETGDKVKEIIKSYYDFGNEDMYEKKMEYLTLLFNNLIRFIGNDFIPLPIEIIPEYATEHCVVQIIDCGVKMLTGIDMNGVTSIEFASRYTCEDVEVYNEVVMSAMEDFLNLNNGIFAVNMSNEYSTEASLSTLEKKDCTIISGNGPVYYVPIVFPFGSVNVVFCGI